MAAGSPIGALLAQMMGGGGAPSAGASPSDSSGLGQAVSQQLSDLQGADPQQLVRQLQQWKSGIAALIPHTAFRIPKMAPHLAQALKGLDKSIEAAAEAATTAATVAQPPLGMSAASPMSGTGGGGF